ncbi:TolC family protein [Treponema primitia]|uniref:TolC family protein n=1 Tax=Treponema primitia TaxID=88058 RepID=UPI00145D4859|nr:TolC family protein [Treponema primitia]
MGLFLVGVYIQSHGQEWDRDKLLSQALGRNNTYLLSASRSREAQSALNSARASRFPVLRFTGNMSYMTNPPGVKVEKGALYPGGPVAVPGMGSIPFPALPDKDITMSLSDNTRYEFGLSLEQPLFTWGRINNSVKAANLGSRASALQMEQERRNIGTALDIHLYTLAYLSSIRAILEEQRRSADRLIVISEESFANGFLLRADLLESKLLTAEVKLGDYGIQETWDNAFLAIKTLTGLNDLDPDSIRFSSETDQDDHGYSPLDKERLLALSKERNLGLKMLSLQTQASERLLAASRGQIYGKPDLGLFLQLGYSGWQDPSLNFTASVGIRSTIFDWGLYQTVRQKNESLAQARLEEEKGRRDLEEYLEKTLRQLELSQYRQEYLSLKIEAGEAQKDQAEAAWKSGYGQEREYLAKELAWYRDRITLLQEELAALVTAIQLESVFSNN